MKSFNLSIMLYSAVHFTHKMTLSAVFPYTKETQKTVKTLNKNLSFNLARLILIESMSTSHSTNLLMCSNHHFSSNGIASPPPNKHTQPKIPLFALMKG